MFALRRCGLPGWDAEVLGGGELEVTWCGGGAMEPIAAGPTVRTLRKRPLGKHVCWIPLREEYQAVRCGGLVQRKMHPSSPSKQRGHAADIRWAKHLGGPIRRRPGQPANVAPPRRLCPRAARTIGPHLLAHPMTPMSQASQ